MKQFVLALLLATTAFAQRLPNTATPSHYALHFTPDVKAATFAGEETIDLQLNQQTNTITLNAAEITFSKVEIEQNGKRTQGKAEVDAEKQMARLVFPSQLAQGKAKLYVEFKGILNDKLRGFYLSKGTNRNYATTQFESTDARRAFPSFDEPAYKATFDVSLTIDKDDTAISNGSIAKDVPGPGANKHTLTFTTSPKMSTYLVAMAVGDWKCMSGEQDGIPVRICSTPDKVQLTPYALKSAKEILHFYNNYYGIRYPFKKLDVLAVPDFEAGAMENTGAIFYRETLLLIDDAHSSVRAHQEVFDVLAHEMAHQWFGDLVTAAWWNDIWLNEGFATWMTYKPHEAVHPEWRGEVEEATETADTLNIDARKSTRAIRQQADTPEQINQLFDGIAYQKAASVLRMVEHFVGPDVFRKGVNQYLSEHAYANATAEDFWGVMTRVSGKPVDKIMRAYTEQPGAPLVSIACSSGQKSTELSQRRFFDNRAALSSPNDQSWTIPVCTRSQNGTGSCELFDQKAATKADQACDQGTYFNADGRGFYRTQYTEDALKALPLSTLKPEERILLLSDEWALGRAGRESIANFMNISHEYSSEPDGFVLTAALDRLETAWEQLVTPADREQFQRYLRQTYSPVLQKIGLDAKPDEAADVRVLRQKLFGVLGGFAADPALVEHSRTLAAQYLKDPDSVDATLAPAVLHIAAENGDAKLYDEYVAALPKMKSPTQMYALLFSLTYFTDPALVKRTILYGASPAVRNQDAAQLFAMALLNTSTRDAAWGAIKENWPAVSKQFTISSGVAVVHGVRTFCSAEAKSDVEQFFATHKVQASDRVLRQSLENIDSCIDFGAAQGENLNTWLQQQAK